MAEISSFLFIVCVIAFCYYIGNLILDNFNEDWRGRLFGFLFGFFVVIWIIPISLILYATYNTIKVFLLQHI